MKLFGRKNYRSAERERIEKEALASIDVAANARERKLVVANANKANSTLNEQLVENGFTVKIFLATGGKHPQVKGLLK